MDILITKEDGESREIELKEIMHFFKNKNNDSVIVLNNGEILHIKEDINSIISNPNFYIARK